MNRTVLLVTLGLALLVSAGCTSSGPAPDAVATETVIAQHIYATLTAAPASATAGVPAASPAPLATPVAPSPTTQVRSAVTPASIASGTPVAPSATSAVGASTSLAPTGAGTATAQVVAVMQRDARLRTGPGVAYITIASVRQGDRLPVLARSGDFAWYQVKSPVAIAWAAAETLDIQGDRGSVPIARTVEPSPTFPPTCQPATDSIFDRVWNLADVKPRLGCATQPLMTLQAAEQPFQRGKMIWWSDLLDVYVLAGDGTYQRMADKWKEGAPEYSCPDLAPSETPPTPLRGFGLVWCSDANVRQQLGQATAKEQGLVLQAQPFQRGLIMRTDSGVYVLFDDDHTWAQR
jgi:hypothetical protein